MYTVFIAVAACKFLAALSVTHALDDEAEKLLMRRETPNVVGDQNTSASGRRPHTDSRGARRVSKGQEKIQRTGTGEVQQTLHPHGNIDEQEKDESGKSKMPWTGVEGQAGSVGKPISNGTSSASNTVFNATLDLVNSFVTSVRGWLQGWRQPPSGWRQTSPTPAPYSIHIAPADTTDNITVDCQWGPWGEWNTCSVTCGDGEVVRLRSKIYESINNGTLCDGGPEESVVCNQPACPFR